MTYTTYHLGLDPGVKNLGYALLKKERGKISVVKTFTLDSAEYFTMTLFARGIIEEATDYGRRELSTVTIERFVPFAGGSTASGVMEDINLLIGAISGIILERKLPEPLLVRSVEWKTRLVKSLVRSKGFSNPSTSLDKKFSFAAAAAVLDVPYNEKITDHVADSIAIAAYPLINLYK